MSKVLMVLVLVLVFTPASVQAEGLIEALTSASKWEGEFRGARRCWGTATFTFEKDGSEIKGKLASGVFTQCYSYTGRSVDVGDITNIEMDGNTISFNVPSGSIWNMEYDASDKELNGSGRTKSGTAISGTFEAVYE